MKTVADIIGMFGGPTKFAGVIGRNPSTASEMKRSGSIPVRYWPSIINSDVGRRHGITSDVLVRAHVKKVESAA